MYNAMFCHDRISFHLCGFGAAVSSILWHQNIYMQYASMQVDCCFLYGLRLKQPNARHTCTSRQGTPSNELPGDNSWIMEPCCTPTSFYRKSSSLGSAFSEPASFFFFKVALVLIQTRIITSCHGTWGFPSSSKIPLTAFLAETRIVGKQNLRACLGQLCVCRWKLRSCIACTCFAVASFVVEHAR